MTSQQEVSEDEAEDESSRRSSPETKARAPHEGRLGTAGDTTASTANEREASARMTLLGVVPALVIALPAFLFVCAATWKASWASLGRDQGIFQYVGWAVARGDVLYRDVRDVNGPVIAMVHLIFQKLGGEDEHRFRVLDLLASGIAFVITGALVPSMAGASPPTTSATKTMRAATVIPWALAAWVMLSAQYLVYGFWDSAQRESFLGWFVIVAMALQAAITSKPDRRVRTRATWMLAASGALSAIPWLGKPTFVLFTLAQVIALLVEPGDTWRDRLRRLFVFAGGSAAGLVVPLLFLVLYGDVKAWMRITFVDVPTMYRFIWPRPAWAIVSLPGYDTMSLTAGLTSLALLVMIVAGKLPRRTLPIALMPVLGLVSVIAQGKGFPYHFHPVTLGTTLAWLVAMGVLWRSSASLPWRAVVVVAAGLVSARSVHYARIAPYPDAPGADMRDKASLESATRLAAYDRVDFFPRALRDAAEYVEASTSPNDRVQTYGMDAYVLFLAKRKSATPYIYAYDLNADAALHGSFDPGGLVPNDAEQARIHALRDDHARDMLERLERAPPPAFVFIDRSPLMSFEDSVEDFSYHCPEAARWLAEHYRQTVSYEGIRVWLRNDVMTPVRHEPPEPGKPLGG